MLTLERFSNDVNGAIIGIFVEETELAPAIKFLSKNGPIIALTLCFSTRFLNASTVKIGSL